MTPRRVLVVSSQVRSVHSGVGTYAGMVLRGLGQLDPAEVVVTVATWDAEVDAEQHPQLRWLMLGALPRRDPTPGRFFTLGKRLVQTLDEHSDLDFDVVHFLDVREGHAFVQSEHRSNVDVIGTVHDDYAALVGRNPLHYRGRAADPLRRFVFHRWLKRLERRCYREFDLLMVNSKATQEAVRRAYQLDGDKMEIVHLTIEPRASEQPEPDLAGAPRLVFCGGNFYRKGLDTCIRALPRILRALPEARLHVVGDCRSASRIRTLAQALDVAHAVEMHGHVAPDRAAAILSAADVFVMPSRTEALGLVYLEAFRAGVPVVAGNLGGVTEIVRDDYSGLLVEPTSPAGVAESVIKLQRDPALRHRLIAGGAAVLAERTPERLIGETLRAYGLPAARQAPDAARERAISAAAATPAFA